MSQRSNIAIFSYAFHPFVGGAELAVEEITKRLPSSHFTCFTNRFNESAREEEFKNMKVVRVNRGTPYEMSFGDKLRYVFLAWRGAEDAHRKNKFGTVWAIMASYGGMAALLFKFRHPRIPLLLTLQEGDSESHILSRVSVFYPVWNLLFRLANGIQVISSPLSDFALRHGAKVKPKIIPNGVDLSKFTYNSKLTTQNEQEKIIITTSRLVSKNGVDILIRAFSILASHKSPASPRGESAVSYKLIIAGDGPELENLKLITKNLELENKVEFLGHVDPKEIPAVLSCVDVFVRASRSEGLGSSFLEAMAVGVPIVATNVGGIKDFLIDGETGLFATLNPEDIAAQIEKLFADQKLYERLSENGRRLVEKHYNWDYIAKQMETIFKDLCA